MFKIRYKYRFLHPIIQKKVSQIHEKMMNLADFFRCIFDYIIDYQRLNYKAFTFFNTKILSTSVSKNYNLN
jgi:hypothetical protein